MATTKNDPTSIAVENVPAINKLAGMNYFITIPAHPDYFVMVEVTTPVRVISKRHLLPTPEVHQPAAKKQKVWHRVDSSRPSTAHIKRIRIHGNACQQCHESRLKCSDACKRPCVRCIERGIKDRCSKRPRKARVALVKQEDESPIINGNVQPVLPMMPLPVLVSGVVKKENNMAEAVAAAADPPTSAETGSQNVVVERDSDPGVQVSR